MEKEEFSKIEKEREIDFKEKSKILSIKEGAALNAMNGFGLKYITPYALAIGANNTIIGLLSSLPSLLGTLSQIKSSKIIEKIPRKKIVVGGAIIQAIMWLPLMLVGFCYFFLGVSSFISSILLLIFYTLIILSGSFPVPAWSSWMKDLTGENPSKYFGKRTRILTLVELMSMLCAGLILEHFKKTGVFTGFLILFTLAFVGRAISAYFLSKKYEPKMVPSEGYYFSFLQFLKKMKNNNFGKYVIFTTLISFATAIASPFFAVYMLKDLALSYYEFTIVLLIVPTMTIIMLPLWGRFASKYGNILTIKISGIFVGFIPLLWLFSSHISDYGKGILLFYLIIIECFSGFWWSGLNLSTTNFVYDAVTRERMAICIAYAHITTAIGVLIGTTIGGFISSWNYPILGLKPILFVFLLSGIARLIVSLVMLPKIKEVRNVDKFKMEMIKTKVMLFPKHLGLGIKRP